MTKRVLVVEDDSLNRLLLVTLLQAKGYEVTEASNGRHAVDALSLFKPDLIVLDIHMPEMNGMEVLARLKSRAEWSDIPVLAVTAYSGNDDMEKILSAGARKLLTKPTPNAYFLETAAKLIDSVH